ncbi:2-amino-4-hydroxy-6-hydroxymethyldihydropteridine diphosphokinase [Desulfococcus sp.]|jgi:2-amino-4-hydroxy-6-hydroxymethyldihydropteridine diphosphokinase|uniref:2-amino-4-hydroxy-6- hydroxymethyldihydropteridine diphosphokinase n=1 Tax=Desulfococcus sp. TaxID=2025834 RepID=UPI003592EED4
MTVDGGFTAFISLGSNIGDKAMYCRMGIAGLAADRRTVITGRSPFYRTEPVDYTDQEWFVNAVVRIHTLLDPFALLTLIGAIERGAGRDRTGVRFGPRTLDMDILFFDDRIIDTPELTVPHPRMHKRRFVLQPLCDIDPAIVHPVFRRHVRYLLDHLDDEGQEIFPYDDPGGAPLP